VKVHRGNGDDGRQGGANPSRPIKQLIVPAASAPPTGQQTRGETQQDSAGVCPTGNWPAVIRRAAVDFDTPHCSAA
jgi:hypothetical protein